MREASAFLPSAKATLNRSRHQRALGLVQKFSDMLHPRCLLDPDDSRSLAYRSLPTIAALVEQLAVALRTAPGGAQWTELWQLYCRWRAILAPMLADFVATAYAAGFTFSATHNSPLGRALRDEFELQGSP